MLSSNNTEMTQQNEKKMELTNFLENSYEFKKIKELAQKPALSKIMNFISTIEESDELTDILYDTNDFDFETTDNIMFFNLGRNKTNALFFASSFFSDTAALGYYILHLREKVIEHLKKQHGPDYDPSIFSRLIPSRKN